MGLWGKVSLIFGPLILVAAVDVLSFVYPFRYHPKAAPAWGVDSVQGDLAFFRLGVPQTPDAFIASQSYRELDEYSRLDIRNGLYPRPWWDAKDPEPKIVRTWGWGGGGFYFIGSRVGPYSETVLPYWPLLVLGCVPPLGALGYLIAHADRYRRPKGLCRRCSYDLRGNTTGICPECGTRWK